MSDTLMSLIEGGLAAVSEADLEGARAALAKAQGEAGAAHPRVTHLQGLVAWLDGDLESAAGHLLAAVDAAPSDPIVQLDAAEFMFVEGELQEAESILRDFLESDGADEGLDDARMLLAQVRLEDDDPEEALEILDAVEAGHDRVEYLASRGGVLLALGQREAAVEAMRAAVAVEPDDADLLYQLGVVLHAAERFDDAQSTMVKVLEMDAARRASEGEDALDSAQERDLKDRFDAMLEEIPEPILKRIAEVPVKVQRAPQVSDVESGLDPRNAVAFVGTPLGPGGDAALEGIVLMRDLLIDGLDEFDGLSEEEQIHELLLEHTLVELRRFFGLEELVVAGVGG